MCTLPLYVLRRVRAETIVQGKKITKTICAWTVLWRRCLHPDTCLASSTLVCLLTEEDVLLPLTLRKEAVRMQRPASRRDLSRGGDAWQASWRKQTACGGDGGKRDQAVIEGWRPKTDGLLMEGVTWTGTGATTGPVGGGRVCCIQRGRRAWTRGDWMKPGWTRADVTGWRGTDGPPGADPRPDGGRGCWLAVGGLADDEGEAEARAVRPDGERRCYSSGSRRVVLSAGVRGLQPGLWLDGGCLRPGGYLLEAVEICGLDAGCHAGQRPSGMRWSVCLHDGMSFNASVLSNSGHVWWEEECWSWRISCLKCT